MNGLHVHWEQGLLLVNVRLVVFYICSGREQDISYIEMREERVNGFWLPLETYSRNEKKKPCSCYICAYSLSKFNNMSVIRYNMVTSFIGV